MKLHSHQNLALVLALVIVLDASTDTAKGATTNGAARFLGSLQQPIGHTNVGFRDIAPFSQGALADYQPTPCTILFSGLSRTVYSIESSDAGPGGPWTAFDSTTATGGVARFTDTGQGGRGTPKGCACRLYRSVLEKGE